ncbi:MAG: hypothetical protein JSS20_03905 [Proteobacteria bacterium]|nr:hypothetical protein [Pseudomonadota bacterium]
MADGSGKPDTIKQANAAAAEAAQEARAEVLNGADVVSPVQRKRKGSAKKAEGSVQFEVSVWITDFNWYEFGLYRHQRNQAKSRQFTNDMDIFAEVTQDGKRTGIIAYRMDLWKKSTGMDKRLVLKLFNDGLSWRASMDLMLGRSLQQTTGAHGLPITSYAMNLNSHDFVVHLERSAHKWWGLPENFSFFLLEEGVPRFYFLRRALINLGGDYTLYNEKHEAVGIIDGRLVSIGGFWQCSVKKEHASQPMLMVLQLFCGMLVFNRGTRRHVRNLYKQIAHGELKPKLQRQETDLYMNPRRVR